MGMFLFKIVGIFVLIYTLWFLSGGVERGEKRHAQGEDSLLIGIEVKQGGESIDVGSVEQPE